MPLIGDKLAQMRAAIEKMAAFSDTPEFQAAYARWEAEQTDTKEREIARRRERMGIPAAFGPVLDSPRLTDTLAKARDFMDGPALFFIALGEAGRGKSIALAEAVDRHGGLFVEASKLAAEGYFCDDVADALKSAKVLSLDELGMEAADAKGWYESKLFSVLNDRFQAGRKTLLASNLTPVEFKARYGSGQLARLWDRISSSVVWVIATGPSMRRAP